MSQPAGRAIPSRRGERRKALAEAIRGRDVERIRALIGADPSLINAGNSHGNDRPLSIALSTGSAVAESLVELGADVNATNHGGWSLLDGASLAGDAEAATWLIRRGVEPKLHHAAGLNDMDLLRDALRTRPEELAECVPRGRGRTPLMFAAYAGAGDAVAALIEAGADIDAADHVGRSALNFAVDRGHVGCAGELLTAGADPNRRGPNFGGSIVHQAVDSRNAEMVRLLARFGARVDARDGSGNTPLHRATRINVAMVEALVEVGADTGATSAAGETPAELARRLGKAKAASLIERASGG